MSLRSAFGVLTITVSIVAIAPVSALAAPSPKDKAEAKTLVADGKKALKEQRWADAINALKKADALDPSPVTELDLAEAQIASGKLIDAGKTLAQANGRDDETPAGQKAREAAVKRLAEIKPRIPIIRVSVQGPTGKVTVLVDGGEVDASKEIQLDPGNHTVAASAEGWNPAEKELKLNEGSREMIELTLAQPNAAPAASGEGVGPRMPGIIVAGGGGALLIVGGVFGGLAISAANTAKAQCMGTKCPASAKGDIDKSKLFGNVSTGLVVVGGAAVAAGVVLAILTPFSGKKDEPKKGARITPWVGLDQVGVAGSF